MSEHQLSERSVIERPKAGERARIRHIYVGYEYHPAPVGARAYCGHVKQTPPGSLRYLTDGPYGDTCLVCWDLWQ